MGSEDELKQAKILDVSLALFTQYGFKKTTMADIAKAARIGKATIYNYFDSKEAVFASVVESLSSDFFRRLRDAVQAAASPEDKVRAWSATLMNIATEAPTKNVTDETLLELMPMAMKARAEDEARVIALLERVIVDATQAGVFHVQDPNAAATALLMAMRGSDPINSRLFDPPDLKKVVEDMIEIFIKGLKTQ